MTAQLYQLDKGLGPDSYVVSGLQGCQGEFAEVTARMPGQGAAVHGWTYRPCASQLTTCDWGGNEPSSSQPAEVSEDAARSGCLALPDSNAAEQKAACTVERFGTIGTIEGASATYDYAVYHYAPGPNPVLDYRRVVVFAVAGAGRVREVLATPGDPAISYDTPRMFESHGQTLMLIPGSDSGTGNLNRGRLFISHDVAWREVDTTSWLNDLAHRLPAGLAVWKGIYPDYISMKAETPLWRKQDSNACPTGGRAELGLALKDDRFVLRSVRLKPASDCGEALPPRALH